VNAHADRTIRFIEPVTTLAIVYFLVKEGRGAWEGEACCDDE
jgi:hypothetical protein